MIFETHVNSIPCQCEVLYYRPGVPMRITGSGFGDADPPEPPEFEFRLLDMKGYPAKWLDRHVTDQVETQLFNEFLTKSGQEVMSV